MGLMAQSAGRVGTSNHCPYGGTPPAWTGRTMWKEPYLETCCRSALHRLRLAGAVGRAVEGKDEPCLQRLVSMGLAAARTDGRIEILPDGMARHDAEIARPRRKG